MGLVDYSDSDSESEAPQRDPQATKPAASSSSSVKPFQKLVSRSNPGKIIVNLPTTAAADDVRPSDEPPAKRARTGAGNGGGRFSNFSSFLPPPKAPAASKSGGSSGRAAPRPGIHLKTGAEPAFSREPAFSDEPEAGGSGSTLNLPPPGQEHQASAEQKPAEEVKLVGKPLMFKPLSVARKPAKKQKPGGGGSKPVAAAAAAAATTVEKLGAAAGIQPTSEPPAKKKKISLFSIPDDSPAADTLPTPPGTGAYEPLFSNPTIEEDATPSAYEDPSYSTYPTDAQAPSAAHATVTTSSNQSNHQSQSLSSIADDLNLSPAARRELFGRGGQPPGPQSSSSAGAKIIQFNMEREYAHNEAIRASGEVVAHNPVRAIAPGKHNLRQLINAAQGNRGALEDSFAAAKSGKKDAAGRYGW